MLYTKINKNNKNWKSELKKVILKILYNLLNKYRS